MPARFLVDYFESDKCVYFSHGVNTDDFYPISKDKPTEPKLLMVANNGLGGNQAFDRKGFTFGVGLAALNNLPITIAGHADHDQFAYTHIAVVPGVQSMAEMRAIAGVS